jgi:nitroreductase
MPARVPSRKILTALVGQAIQAPSSHNTQPWIFAIAEGRVELWADRTRALPVNDPVDRELTISCGAALLNLRVGAASKGLVASATLLPERDEPDLLARVSFAPAAARPRDATLAKYIARRRTYRQRFALRPVPDEAAAAFAAAAGQEAAWFHPLTTDAQREAAAALVAEGDAAQWADPRWRRELASWMHPRRRGEGLTVPGLAQPFAQAVVRTFDMGKGVGARDRQLADESPLLAVLGTPGDGPADWLAAGQALERVLLTAVAHGLQASYLNQPVQVGALRPRLATLTGHAGHPQVLLRLGVPVKRLTAAPRRPVAAVIDQA